MQVKDFEEQLRNITIPLPHNYQSPIPNNHHCNNNIVTIPIKIIYTDRESQNQYIDQGKDDDTAMNNTMQIIKQKPIVFSSTDVIKRNRISPSNENPMTLKIPRPNMNQAISSQNSRPIIHISCEKTVYHRKKTQDHQRQWTPQNSDRSQQCHETYNQSQSKVDKEYESQGETTVRTIDRRSTTNTDMSNLNPDTFFKNKNTPIILQRQRTNMTVTSADTKIEIPTLITEATVLHNDTESNDYANSNNEKKSFNISRTEDVLFDEHMKNLAEIQSNYDQMKNVVPNETVKGIKGIKIHTLKGSDLIRHNLKKFNLKFNNQAKLKEKMKRTPINQYKNHSSTLFKKYCTNYSFKTSKSNGNCNIEISENGSSNNTIEQRTHSKKRTEISNISNQINERSDIIQSDSKTNGDSSINDNKGNDINEKEYRTITISPPINIFNIISNQSPQAHIQTTTSTSIIDKQEIIITSSSPEDQIPNPHQTSTANKTLQAFHNNPAFSSSNNNHNTHDYSSCLLPLKKRYNDNITNKEVLARFLANNTKTLNSSNTHSRNSNSPIDNSNPSIQFTSSIILPSEPSSSISQFKDDQCKLYFNYSHINPHNCVSGINIKDLETEDHHSNSNAKQLHCTKLKDLPQTTPNTLNSKSKFFAYNAKTPRNPILHLNNSFLDHQEKINPITHRFINKNKQKYLMSWRPKDKGKEIRLSKYDTDKNKEIKIQNTSYGDHIKVHGNYLSETLNTCLVDEIEKREHKQELYQRAFGKVDYKSFELQRFAKTGECSSRSMSHKIDIEKKNGGKK